MIQKTEAGCFSEIICTKSPQCVEFFHQQEAGPVLLCYTWDNYVTVSVLHFPQLESDVEEYTYENLTDMNHKVAATNVAWSPKTSMLNHPVGIIFCTSSIDFKLRVFTVDNKMKVDVNNLGEHSSFINDISYEPIHGKEIASVGDDKKCRVWSVEESKQIACIPLTSAGKTVNFNINDPGKLLVGEENGRIRMYDTATYQPIFSLQSVQPSTGLISCDWSLVNTTKIGAVIGKQWLIWDTTKGSLPEVSGQAHSGMATDFKWSNISDSIFATRGRPDNQIKIYFTHENKITSSTATKIGNGFSWHNLLPIYAVGANRKIMLFDLEQMR